jgi:hypothetical protein
VNNSVVALLLVVEDVRMKVFPSDRLSVTAKERSFFIFFTVDFLVDFLFQNSRFFTVLLDMKFSFQISLLDDFHIDSKR